MSLLAALTLFAIAPERADAADTIVVTGTPVTREEARKQAVEFVRRAGVAELQPVARWISPVCPRVSGVAPDVAGKVEDQIRRTAAAVGAPVGKAGCSTNIAIYFTKDGNGAAQSILDRAPRLFQQMEPDARTRLLTGGDAIRWWHTTRIQGRHGASPTDAPTAQTGIDGGEGGGGPISGALAQYNSSLISTQAVRALFTASIIIDVEQAAGYSLDAVGAFAAMVALAEFDSDPPPPDGSILGLFGDAKDRRSLSARDMALLEAIYSLPPDREARQHRRQLVGALTRDAATAR